MAIPRAFNPRPIFGPVFFQLVIEKNMVEVHTEQIVD
jgi:hypothetical protein